ncbi:metallophosphoesterase family protein [Blastopirellula marina]|uniref:Serine/threonine protein phosphatase n=1 Tax=Blastopirellula marina TaxID=124 RepID=A0A2S8GPY3_9BACT|nr:metallophosphoesterase family protein [Blastopirellula marina]PQO46411.1 serine/threonine protein phosphatase [Blastopirellula marina]
MRTLAIGDIHGCLTALDTLLDMVAPTDNDRIVTLGDYVDRGPDSRGVIDRVLDLRTKYETIHLMGNHEIMMIEARDDAMAFGSWMQYGGEETLLSYEAPWDKLTREQFDRIASEHWEFLTEKCLPYYETDTHIFVHANVLPDLPLDEQEDETLFWDKFANNGPHQSGKTVICGHTSQKSGWPLNVGHSICIDTWVYSEGWLTCLDVDRGDFWQANEKGQRRSGVLA